MRLVCVDCDCVYGEGENKPRYGYCRECWRLVLLKQEQNRRRMWAAHEREFKRVPLLSDFHTSKRSTPAAIAHAFRDDEEIE